MRLALLVLLATSAAGEICRESLTGVYCRYPDGRVTFRSAAAKPPLFYQSGGFATALLNQPTRIFDPNPVAALNDPSLMDNNDSPSAVPGHAYENVTIDLLGPHARIVDLQAPHTTQPDPLAPLMFDRGDDRFEPVNAYFHVDRMQRHLQSLGYSGTRQLVAYPIEIDAHALNGADASQFLPSMQIGRGTLFYGTGGTDDAEDADIVVHEYGHAILEWIAPATFSGPFASESRALSEAFGDYLAFSAHYERRVASGRDPFCFADWDPRCWTDAPAENCVYAPGSDCLRRLDSTRTMSDYQRSGSAGVEHRNGEIWSSALRDLYLTLGRRTTDTLVIEALFGVPPRPTFASMAARLVTTDRLLNNGRNTAAICGVMNVRGIGVSCDGTPRGELTYVQSPDRNAAIPDLGRTESHVLVTDPRAIESVAVRLDIEHSSRGDLRIELVAPDGTRVTLLPSSGELAAGVHVTLGPLEELRGKPAAGRWTLSISDTRFRDAGTLLSWSLIFQFAGDEPQTERPRAARAQMLPVVAHVFGAGTTPYASDVRIANVTAAPEEATLIFTRSGEDGTRDFSAVDVHLGPGQTAAFDDVVSTVFSTAGSGSLEILGNVVVSSRTYARAVDGGTVGSQVMPDHESAGRTDFPIFAAALPFTMGDRFNLGVTEISGKPGTVRIDLSGPPVSGAPVFYAIAPFSHLQIRIPSPFAAISVVEGDARVVGYLSQVDDRTRDAMIIPALRQANRQVIAPAISATGATARWQTDLWLTAPVPGFPFIISLDYVTAGRRTSNLTLDETQFDVVAAGFEHPETAGTISFFTTGEMFAHSRITNGLTSQYVPFLAASSSDQHLLFIDNSAGYRTNIGISSERPAIAEAIIYDSAGSEVERQVLATAGGIAQGPVKAVLTAGRAVVRFLSGTGRAYASLIDTRSGDATFIGGQ